MRIRRMALALGIAALALTPAVRQRAVGGVRDDDDQPGDLGRGAVRGLLRPQDVLGRR
ncbi:hypothetical protein [Fodinicola feengrottensis]|uniref:hypothetical protein n=1 Tax=Fodinicola feengrottensis TaxID=435914 RepID=UPI0013D529FE|nr:hypothetical protein [Fodinicola feengrottensis]